MRTALNNKQKEGRSLVSLLCIRPGNTLLLRYCHYRCAPCRHVTSLATGLSRGVQVVLFLRINWHATCHVLSGCVRVGCVPSSLTLNCENNSRKCEVTSCKYQSSNAWPSILHRYDHLLVPWSFPVASFFTILRDDVWVLALPKALVMLLQLNFFINLNNHNFWVLSLTFVPQVTCFYIFFAKRTYMLHEEVSS